MDTTQTVLHPDGSLEVPVFPCDLFCRTCGKRETCTPPPAGESCGSVTLTAEVVEKCRHAELRGDEA